ncbi:serine/threonine-protein kinase [Crocosphaera sp.]|uniref:serine/threonine protein kinase n=1 Tax=Crocosphaera sp. TaxID=2729996 RepID=UPI00262E4F3A|nr:serine/threonine-protein kinase [Crocosphaera sp.]MDJ0578865.1 serine/threonine-protein kinase [Crocosphaera sp.]
MINSIIADRYKICDRLGEGGTAITYKAVDLNTSQEVAIKVLSLDNVDWKQADLFEKREVKTLRQLNHPRIPRYIDYFVSDHEDNFYCPMISQKSLQDFVEAGILLQKFYLVQELVKGKNLVEWRDNINKVNQKEIENIAIQVLDILTYLQTLIPPVVHRDIKPQNLIYTENKEIFLVDFGAVPDQVGKTSYGTTFVGTQGYMAPEQGSGGKVSLATDLYGLGATLIYLLSGRNPSDLPLKRLKINFRQEIKLSSKFAQWLDVLLEFEPENRFQNAQIALNVLEGQGNIKDYIKKNLGRPKYSSISLTKTKQELMIKIPCALNRKRWNYALGILGISFYIIAFLILLIITISTYNIFWRIPIFIYAFLLVLQPFKKFKDVKIVKLVILVGSILPFILNVNYSIIASFLILIIETFSGDLISKIVRDLLFDTQIKIKKNTGIFLQEKFSFLVKQNRKLLFKETSLSKISKLLTRREKQWLNDEIKRFLKD